MHSDIKNILESVKTRLDEAKDQISKLKEDNSIYPERK